MKNRRPRIAASDALRAAAGRSRRWAMAATIGVHPSAVTELLYGVVPLTPGNRTRYRRLAEVLGIDPDAAYTTVTEIREEVAS